MTDEEKYDAIKDKLRKDFFIITRNRFWSFLGGMITFLIVAGIISYKASLSAIESTTAKNTIETIVSYEKESESSLKVINTNMQHSDQLLKNLNQKIASLNGLVEELRSIRELVEKGNPWIEYSEDIKDVIKDSEKYEYAIIRNGGFRILNWSAWNKGYRVMTDHYMIGDNQPFRLGGSMWIWDTDDPRDDKGVCHLYYISEQDGIKATTSGNFQNKSPKRECIVYRRIRK